MRGDNNWETNMPQNIDEAWENLLIAIYKQAVDDIKQKSLSKVEDRETAIKFLSDSEFGRKCIEKLEREGYKIEI